MHTSLCISHTSACHRRPPTSNSDKRHNQDYDKSECLWQGSLKEPQEQPCQEGKPQSLCIYLLYTWMWCHPRSGGCINYANLNQVLPDETESKVYVFSDRTHEQFLAHVMKSVSLIDKQLHHFNQLKKMDTVLSNVIQEHESKKEKLDRFIQVSSK